MSKSVALITGAAFVFAAQLVAAQGQPPASAPRTNPGSQGAPKAPATQPDPRTPTNNTTPSAQNAPAADAFLKKVAQGDMAEIELSQLAQQKSTNDQIKAFAKMIVDDHTKTSAEVKSMAQTKKITLPTDLAAAQKATKAQLEKSTGAVFDRAYANAMVNDHQNAIREFEMAAKSTDPEVKSFAEKTLPALRHHLEEARKLSK